MQPSIFLDFQLPNAATWFYFSLILTIAIFFQFSRLLSLRNLDLLTLFLLVPGFLLLLEAHTLVVVDDSGTSKLSNAGQREVFLGYIWLLVGSGYWFIRSIIDLALIRRPVMIPNLSTTGLAWLGGALLICLTAVAVRRSNDSVILPPVGSRPIPIEQIKEGATAVVRHTQSHAEETSTIELQFWVQRSLAMGCHVAVAIGLLMIGLRHFQDLNSGVALGTLYLLIPYTAFHISQFHIVWPAAFITWAVFCYRRPVITGWLLGVAAGSAFVPIVLFPVWIGFYSKRGVVRFTLAYASALGLSVGIVALVLWWDGWLTTGISASNLTDWLPWRRPDAESIWRGVHGAYRLPIFVLYIAFVAVLSIWPSPKNLSHLVSLSAALLIGIQFWHADRGGVYILWYLPLILMMTLRPNLAALGPAMVEPGDTRMLRWAGYAWRRVRPGRSSSPSNELAV